MSLPASQEGIDHEHQVGRLLLDGSPKVAIALVVNEDQLTHTCAEDGEAQQRTAENEGQEEPVIPLQHKQSVILLISVQAGLNAMRQFMSITNLALQSVTNSGCMSADVLTACLHCRGVAAFSFAQLKMKARNKL